jgi:hypothetical protein
MALLILLSNAFFLFFYSSIICRFQMDLTPYPTLSIISRHLMKYPSFSETQPSRMIDKPADASDIVF